MSAWLAQKKLAASQQRAIQGLSLLCQNSSVLTLINYAASL
ncbi:hypothetical protein AWB68_02583 [Caballeronia choica]|uniref:Uncharacterized protein n=1 Tax=Caballeronia choica TaxID=326476 RepID=A0A158IAF3_9BURK|nr:hypothetical protein [Caballeronia choica]SAL53363.1 hypothetical protein AWB68_02583 [Caballeronia choica]